MNYGNKQALHLSPTKHRHRGRGRIHGLRGVAADTTERALSQAQQSRTGAGWASLEGGSAAAVSLRRRAAAFACLAASTLASLASSFGILMPSQPPTSRLAMTSVVASRCGAGARLAAIMFSPPAGGVSTTWCCACSLQSPESPRVVRSSASPPRAAGSRKSQMWSLSAAGCGRSPEAECPPPVQTHP